MSNIQDMISSLIDSIKNTGKKTNAYDTSAEVKRIEGDTAWVHIPGGADETPVKMTINASEGDNVQVRVSGGRAWLQGNATAPPTDDTTANVARTIATDAQEEAVRAGKAADAAEAEAVRAGAAADRAEESASDALTAAQSAQTSADSALVSLATVEDVAGVLEWITNHGTMTLTSDVTVNPSHVYFVVDAGGDYVVGSTHYSIVSEPKDSELSTYYELSVDKSIQNYVATHVVVDSEGLWLIPDSGGNKVLIATGAGSSYTTAGTYIIGKVNGVDTVFAKFLSSGATMSTENGTQIAHLGYGSGNAQSGTANAPYYTLGTRKSGSAVGNYSVAIGTDNTASGYCSFAGGKESVASSQNSFAMGSKITYLDTTYYTTASDLDAHAEGMGTQATNDAAHAEGTLTTASGDSSHSEGYRTTASGFAAHAEGDGTVASGNRSHAQNTHTTAAYDNQTAIGIYNSNSSSNAFEIGNGTSSNPQNAFTVDWSGNVNIPSSAKYKINGTALTASDVGALSSSTTYVSGVKGNSESTYRTGNVNITPANVGAVNLSDKYTRSSAGDLAWTGQTDGDAKVIAKSALAFWNGAYSGNGSNLSKCSTGNIIGSNGGTMTGQLLTSFKSAVAMGSYGTAQTTVDGFVGEVRYSSGCMGSVSINTAYTKNGTTIPTGWYNFIYSPHRSGGNSGAASGDNCNYGTLILSGMTMSAGPYFIQVNGGSIQSVKLISSTGGWVLAGSATGTNTVTISDSNASEVYVKVNPVGSAVYSATIMRADLQSVWYVGGYYYSASDYGIINLNVSNSNKTFQLRNVRQGGSDVKSSSTLTVYYR